MSVWISVTTSPFENTEARQRQPQENVRRPLRGIEIKEDTYAVMRVITASGEDLRFLDSSSSEVAGGIGSSTHYSNFILQSVQEQRAEKSQIVETFGEDYIFFFGERPRFLTISGILMNTKDFNWKSEFWDNYENLLRGTRLVERNARLYLYFDDVVVEGFMMQAAATWDNANPYMLPLQFQMFVCNYAVLSNVGSVFFQETPPAVDMDEDNPADARGLAPPTQAARQEAASNAARIGSSGGLNSFLSAARRYVNTADFSIQSTLEIMRNTFYGRRLVLPEGLGSGLTMPPIQNLASLAPGRTGVQISEMGDEYVKRAPSPVAYDNQELQRVQRQMKLRTPEELERAAKAKLAELGVDTSGRETTYALLGRGAFAATQTMGSFAIRQAQGTLTLP